MYFDSKLPHVKTTIFTKMSALANQYNAINLSQGFPDFDPDPALIEMVHYYMMKGKNQYAPMSGVQELRTQIAVKLGTTHRINLDPDKNINITAGGTQAIFTAIMTFVRPGDEVIVLEPAFDCYEPALSLIGAKVVAYEMEPPEFKVDWNRVADLISDRTSMIITNTPHNPTGQVLGNQDFEALQSIVKGKDIVVLSDEVYEHLIYDGNKHVSILDFPSLFSQSIAVYSFGKTFHCTGWKVGYAVMHEKLMKEFRKVHQFNVFSVNSFVQYGISDYLKNAEHYQTLPEFYQKKRDILSHYILESKLELIPSKGTYFVLAKYTNNGEMDDVAYAEWITQHHQLAVIPVSVFYSSKRQDSLIRFCFAKKDETLHSAGHIILNL